MEIKAEAWRKFIEAMDFESDTNNYKYDFNIMTRKYGNAFIQHCKVAWEVNDGVQTEEEFCRMNANMPVKIFEKIIKPRCGNG